MLLILALKQFSDLFHCFHSYCPCMCSDSWLLLGLLQCILTGFPGSMCLRATSLLCLKYRSDQVTFPPKTLLSTLEIQVHTPGFTTLSPSLLHPPHLPPPLQLKSQFSEGTDNFWFPSTSRCLMPQFLCSCCLPCLAGPFSLSSQTDSSLFSRLISAVNSRDPH